MSQNKKYINFGSKLIDIDDPILVIKAYEEGFVMTRVALGHMEKVRSIRINLGLFDLSSENKRILKKFDHHIEICDLPMQEYDWRIHKMGKDFYDTKFGRDTFSANKIKEILTTKFNFNTLLKFKNPKGDIDGYCIALKLADSSKNTLLLHYAYPFYKLELINTNFGMYMMTSTIKIFKELGYQYIYLGSCHDEKAKYKLQFKGIEWYDEQIGSWSTDIGELKNRIRSM